MLFLGVLLLLLLRGGMVVADNYDTHDEQKEYFLAFKYMGEFSVNPEISEMVDGTKIFKKAVENFQAMAGINITGEINDETKEFMRLPRCGVADQVSTEAYTRRKKRYALGGQKWEKNQLTYRFNKITNQLSSSVVKRIFRKAFDAWQDNSMLSFTEVFEPQPADIIVDFVIRDHGDNNPFDGRGRVLAHAYFPSPGIGGDAHFDDEEIWTDQSQQGTNLLQVAIHELGHSLGLSHSNTKGAIMQAFYQGYVPDAKLHWDDIAGIQALYGKPRQPTQPRPNPTPRTAPPTPRKPDTSNGHYHLCQIRKVDAICSAEDKIMVFSGSKFFVMDGYGHDIKNVEAYDITSMFLDITRDPIDFATTDRPAELEGFLKLHSKGKVWKYKYNLNPGTVPHNYISLMSGYPRDERRDITGFPVGIDAGFTWKQNGHEYYFKDNIYYRKRSQFSWMDGGYPKSLRIWKGVPSGIDAVFSYIPERREEAATFFFKGANVYVFNEAIDKVDTRFPSGLASFFGCEAPRSGKLEEWNFSPRSVQTHWMMGVVVLLVFVV